jgi:hypothetical protein
LKDVDFGFDFGFDFDVDVGFSFGFDVGFSFGFDFVRSRPYSNGGRLTRRLA